MKCSQSYGLLYIFILISLFSKTYCKLSKRNLNNLQKLQEDKNLLNSWNSLPIMGNNRFHKIVKKQMTVSDYLKTRKRKRSSMTDKASFESLFQIENRIKDKNSLGNAFYDKVPKKCNSRMHKRYESKRVKNSFPAFYGRKDDMKENLEKSKTEENDMKNLVGRPCKHYVRFADKGDCHYFYECEVESDGCMKFKHKKCPEGEVFAPEYLECLKASYLKIIRRPKRKQPQNPKKIDLPDATPEGDQEPSNEWLDASQGTNPKIPSEFKPRRKPKLRIYHLKCKRRPNRMLQEVPQKRHAFHTLTTMRDLAKNKRQTFRRHHPRSFLVRSNKKEDSDSKEKGNHGKDDEDDEESEEYDDDETEEEDDEDTEEQKRKQNEKKKQSQTDTQKENIKNVYKSSHTATTNDVKFDEGSSSYSKVDKPSFLSDKTLSDETVDDSSENSKKVLIDASIKVDSAISKVLKDILSKRKEKSIRDDSKNFK